MKNIEVYKNIKVLEIHRDYFIGAKGYHLYKYTFSSKKYEYVTKVDDKKYALLSHIPIIRRLFRAEINNIYTLKDGTQLLIAKKGIFRKKINDKIFSKCLAIPRGSRPLNLCVTPAGDIYFGEYFANVSRNPVHIYHSSDQGSSWEIAYTFDSGNINHIHGIFWDKYTNRIWYVSGDLDNECIIGYTEDKFKTVVELFRGGQEFRTCNLFFYPEFVVYATDSQYMVNEIKIFNRKNCKIDTIASIQGTAIKGGQIDDFAYISTTVEPSEVNKDCYSHLWITNNGKDWREIYKAPKDCLPAIFQFGSIEFPNYLFTPKEKFIFSGRAVKHIGGNSIAINI